MPPIGTFLLSNVFSALLPPVNPEDREFYDILGVDRNATNEEIRKAYKKQSLKLHPDKVAQRKEANAELAAAEYEKVQEAYSVLVNDEKRQRYDALKYSPTRYRFVNQGTLQNPGAMYENLTGASFVDKTRLVVLCSLIVMIVLMQPILIATKINHSLEERGALEDAKWVVILLPYWILGALFVLFWMVIAVVAPGGARVSVGLTVLEHLAWYVGVFMLARKWDGNDQPYGKTLIPIYLAMALRWIQSMLILQKLRHDVRRMVTVEYLETEVLKGKSLEDLSEQELEDLRHDFVVVTVPPDFEPILEEDDDDGQVELDDKALEEQKVESSPEYETATDLYNSTFGGLVASFVFGIVFLIVLTLKLDRKIDANWWTVFTPIWICFGSKWIYNFYNCVCGTVTGEEIIFHMQDQQEGEDDDDNETKDENDDDRPCDGNFVEPEQSANDFNKSAEIMKDTTTPAETKNTTPAETKNTTTPKEDRSDDEVEADTKKKKTTKEQTTKRETETQQPSEESKPEAPEEKKDDNGDAESKDKDDDDEPDEPNIHIDEETFKAWQNAYEAAEQGAMEEQAKSSMECCTLSIKIMLLCLVVAKVEKNFDKDDPENVGFNTFWIIFPFLLFFGCVFCCCSCAIYGASPGDAADLHEVPDDDLENPPATADEDTNNVMISEPPSGDESAVEISLGASTTGGSNSAGASTAEVSTGVSIAEASTTTEASTAGASNTTDSIFSGLSSVQECATNETQDSDNPKVLDTLASSIEDLD